MMPPPPDRSSSTFVVTGGTGGLGYFTAERLARTGARVVITGRDAERTERALASIRWQVAGARVDAVALDLADLASVRRAAAELAVLGRVDALVLNAGLTSPPSRRTLTGDGFELTWATNLVGHAALVGLLWPTLAGGGAAAVSAGAPHVRVVGLGSLATRVVPFDVADLGGTGGDEDGARPYRPFRTYALSKHGVHAWVAELARQARGTGVEAVLAHPGYAVDALTPPRSGIVSPGRFERLPFAQGKHEGARPTLRAVLDPGLRPGDLVGPRMLTRGAPVVARAVASSTSPEAGRAVWELLHEQTRGALPRDLSPSAATP